MSKECPICISEFKTEIERQFENGNNYQSILDWCKKQKFRVSLASIKRHLESHNESVLNDDPIIDALTLEIPQFKNKDEIKKFTHEKIIEGYALQIAIITQKQRLYMQGKGKYPNTEIAGLKTFLDALGFISDVKDSIFNRK